MVAFLSRNIVRRWGKEGGFVNVILQMPGGSPGSPPRGQSFPTDFCRVSKLKRTNQPTSRPQLKARGKNPFKTSLFLADNSFRVLTMRCVDHVRNIALRFAFLLLLTSLLINLCYYN